ncbi:unnamed protein product [Parajaminaea phylloscopi]
MAASVRTRKRQKERGNRNLYRIPVSYRIEKKKKKKNRDEPLYALSSRTRTLLRRRTPAARLKTPLLRRR